MDFKRGSLNLINEYDIDSIQQLTDREALITPGTASTAKTTRGREVKTSGLSGPIIYINNN